MEIFSKYQKNGRWSFLSVSQDHFDQISATYHTFWQILSKKCEIIENRKKLPNLPNLSKIVFFILFSSQSKFFDLESIKPIKLLILGKFWVMRHNNSKISLFSSMPMNHFCSFLVPKTIWEISSLNNSILKGPSCVKSIGYKLNQWKLAVYHRTKFCLLSCHSCRDVKNCLNPVFWKNKKKPYVRSQTRTNMYACTHAPACAHMCMCTMHARRHTHHRQPPTTTTLTRAPCSQHLPYWYDTKIQVENINMLYTFDLKEFKIICYFWDLNY